MRANEVVTSRWTHRRLTAILAAPWRCPSPYPGRPPARGGDARPGNRRAAAHGFMYRTPDFRHQVLEISAPVPMAGDTPTAFARCADEVSAAIGAAPRTGHWAEPATWPASGFSRRMRTGHRSPADPAQCRPTVEPTLLADREFAHDGRADNVAARG